MAYPCHLFDTIALRIIFTHIHLLKIVERVDVLLSMIVFIGIGVKTAGFVFGAVIGLQTITPFRYKPALLLLSIIIYALTFLSSRLTEFLWFGLHVAAVVTSIQVVKDNECKHLKWMLKIVRHRAEILVRYRTIFEEKGGEKWEL